MRVGETIATRGLIRCSSQKILRLRFRTSAILVVCMVATDRPTLPFVEGAITDDYQKRLPGKAVG